MKPYSHELLKRQEKEARTNPYDDLPREERSARYLRCHSFEEKGPDQRETRDYLESIARLLPMPPGSAPITKSTMDKLFRKSESQKRKEAKRAAVEAATKIAKG